MTAVVSCQPRILLDLLPYSPTDGGFTTSIHALLEVARELEEFEFGLVYHHDFHSRFAGLPFRQHPVCFPRKLKFFAPLAVIPPLVWTHGYRAVHGDISLVPYGTGVPTSMRVHDLYYLVSGDRRNGSLLHRAFEQAYRALYVRSIRRASIASAISECTRRDMARLAGRRGVIPLLPHAIAVPPAPPVPRSWPAPGEAVRLLFIGSIVPRKNLRVLLDAMPLLERPWTLDVVGNVWWGAGELERHAGDKRITVHGFAPEAEMVRLLRRAHLLVTPSLYEGFGLPAAEAVSGGCLALAARGSAFDEFVPAAARFDPRSPSELADLVNRMNAEKYGALLAEAFSAIRRFSRENQVQAYRALFRTLVDPAGVPSPPS